VVAIVGLAVAAALVGGLLATRAWHSAHRTGLERSLSVVPAPTKRLAFTDWSAVRHRLGVSADPDATPDDVGRWLQRAFPLDLSAASSIDESGAALQEHYGFSPGNAEWEAYAQSDDGAAMILRLDDDADFGEIADRLRRTGYQEPKDDTGVWIGGVDLVAGLDPTLTPEVQYVALLGEQHLVVTSDSAAYAETAARVAAGDGRSLADTERARALVSAVEEPAAAIVWAGDFACTDLAMSQADENDQQRADDLIADAGGVDPLAGLVMALAPNRTLTVAEHFESADQARANLRPRAKLAVGEAVGRGGSGFADDLRLTGSRTQDANVLLTFRPVSDSVFPLSSLYDGPVLFATC